MPVDVLPHLQCFRVQHVIFIYAYIYIYNIYIYIYIYVWMVNVLHLAVQPFYTVSWNLDISATRVCTSFYCSDLSSCGFVQGLLNGFLGHGFLIETPSSKYMQGSQLDS